MKPLLLAGGGLALALYLYLWCGLGDQSSLPIFFGRLASAIGIFILAGMFGNSLKAYRKSRKPKRRLYLVTSR